MSDPFDRVFAPLRRTPAVEPTPLPAIAARAARLRRRRRQRGTAAGSLVAAGLAAGLLTAGPLGPGRPVTVTSPPASAAPRAGAGLAGELAYVSGQSLVVDRSGRRHTVALPGRGGPPSAPAWAPDGKWLAFSEGSGLWICRASGAGAHAVAGTVVSWAWSPRGDVLAFTTPARTAGRYALLTATPPTGAGSSVPLDGHPAGLAWSPSGRQIAVSVDRYATPAVGVIELVAASPGLHAARTVASAAGAGLDVASWWPDGKGLLYWNDPQFSSSIAADGLPLVSFDIATRKAHTLATMLPHADWLAWSPDGGTVAVVAGGDRVVWDGAKHLALCQVVAGTCRAEAQPKGTTSLDPAWTGGGQLLFARSTGTAAYTMGPPPGVTGVAGAPFGWKATEGWAGIGQLRVVQAQAGEPAPSAALAGGAGGQEPTPAGAGILFVRGGALWLLRYGSASPARLTGRLGSYGPANPGYYGYIDWHDEFAWHA
jgi:hypothetical protein